MSVRSCEGPVTSEATALSVTFVQNLAPLEALLLHRGPSVRVSAGGPRLGGCPAPAALSEDVQQRGDEQTQAQHQQHRHHDQLLQVAGALRRLQGAPVQELRLFRLLRPQGHVPAGGCRLSLYSTCFCSLGPRRGTQPGPCLCGGDGGVLGPAVAAGGLSHRAAPLLDVVDGHSLLVAVLRGQAEVGAQRGGGGHKAQAAVPQDQVQVWGQPAVGTLPQLLGQQGCCGTLQTHHLVQRHRHQLT